MMMMMMMMMMVVGDGCAVYRRMKPASGRSSARRGAGDSKEHRKGRDLYQSQHRIDHIVFAQKFLVELLITLPSIFLVQRQVP